MTMTTYGGGKSEALGSMLAYAEAVDRKAELLDKLNKGQFVREEWINFISFAQRNGMRSMAKDMAGRFNYYVMKGG